MRRVRLRGLGYAAGTFWRAIRGLGLILLPYAGGVAIAAAGGLSGGEAGLVVGIVAAALWMLCYAAAALDMYTR